MQERERLPAVQHHRPFDDERTDAVVLARIHDRNGGTAR
jgi:hypothetical protein